MVKSVKQIVRSVFIYAALVSAGVSFNVYAADKPVIGISWESNDQAADYAALKKIIEQAGGIPVELPQIKSQDVNYTVDGKVVKSDLNPSGMLKTQDAEEIKAKNFDRTNAAAAMKDIDAVFFTGGEDISPSLYKKPQSEANGGEAINAARDISDYTLMAYSLDHDVPFLAVCRGAQMMAIVSGADFIQDIPAYYANYGKVYYEGLHRMPAGADNQDYARHDVDILPVKSYLNDIVDGDELKNISSWHHQAIGSLEGTDLIKTAQTVDKGVAITEGIENPKKPFAVGLQFHPENDLDQVMVQGKNAADYMDQKIALQFFKELVKAASKE